jgi:hypothetical protein
MKYRKRLAPKGALFEVFIPNVLPGYVFAVRMVIRAAALL